MRSFAAFVEDMGLKPLGWSIDRINNDSDYEPSNCRWSTSRQQARNRCTTHLITYRGRTLSLIGWAEELGINRSTLSKRICKCGWSVEKAFATPRIAARKLNLELACKIRGLHKAGVSTIGLARRFNVSVLAIQRIVRGEVYTEANAHNAVYKKHQRLVRKMKRVADD